MTLCSFRSAFTARSSSSRAQATPALPRTSNESTGPPVPHTVPGDELEVRRGGVVEVDLDGGGHGLSDAQGGLVEVPERRLHGDGFEPEVGETFGAAAAP